MDRGDQQVLKGKGVNLVLLANQANQEDADSLVLLDQQAPVDLLVG